MKINKNQKPAVFFWDYKQLPPIKWIVNFARKNPDLKIFDMNNGADGFVLIFAKNKKEAIKCAIDEGMISGQAFDEGEKLEDWIKVTPWKDEE